MTISCNVRKQYTHIRTICTCIARPSPFERSYRTNVHAVRNNSFLYVFRSADKTHVGRASITRNISGRNDIYRVSRPALDAVGT